MFRGDQGFDSHDPRIGALLSHHVTAESNGSQRLFIQNKCLLLVHSRSSVRRHRRGFFLQACVKIRRWTPLSLMPHAHRFPRRPTAPPTAPRPRYASQSPHRALSSMCGCISPWVVYDHRLVGHWKAVAQSAGKDCVTVRFAFFEPNLLRGQVAITLEAASISEAKFSGLKILLHFFCLSRPEPLFPPAPGHFTPWAITTHNKGSFHRSLPSPPLPPTGENLPGPTTMERG